jgi:hypothetical protein
LKRFSWGAAATRVTEAAIKANKIVMREVNIVNSFFGLVWKIEKMKLFEMGRVEMV